VRRIVRNAAALVTEPKPALGGVSRFGSADPSASVREFRIVIAVGLLSWIVVCRPVNVTMLKTLNASARSNRQASLPIDWVFWGGDRGESSER
jgi:hypothetical protein